MKTLQETIANKLLATIREKECAKVQDFIAEARTEAFNTDLKRQEDGVIIQQALLSRGFLKVRDIKAQYRPLYEAGIVSYCQTHFPNEVVKCGLGGTAKKSILIHPLTIEKATKKFWEDFYMNRTTKEVENAIK